MCSQKKKFAQEKLPNLTILPATPVFMRVRDSEVRMPIGHYNLTFYLTKGEVLKSGMLTSVFLCKNIPF